METYSYTIRIYKNGDRSVFFADEENYGNTKKDLIEQLRIAIMALEDA